MSLTINCLFITNCKDGLQPTRFAGWWINHPTVEQLMEVDGITKNVALMLAQGCRAGLEDGGHCIIHQLDEGVVSKHVG